jgi:diguanylate cyclase (GGDEF)-like protein
VGSHPPANLRDESASADEAVPARVLVVEDSLAYAELLDELLQEEWPDVMSVRAGRLAEALKLTANSEFDCALLDLSLPDSQGLAGIYALRESAPGLPIIVLTGTDDEAMAIQAVQEGAQDYLVKQRVDDRRIPRAIRYAMERKRTEVELARQASHDPLTSLANRALFADRLTQAQARARRNGRALAVMFIDLDGFKTINDSLGHDAGDVLLVDVARRLGSLLRPADTLARFGGDEFVLLCEQLADARSVEPILRRMRDALAAGFTVHERHVPLSASVGVVMGNGDPENASELLRQADLAMYEAKHETGFSFRFYENGMHARAVERLDVRSDLRRAIARRDLAVHYQPIVRVPDASIVAVEALVRWPHPLRGILSASEFVPEAETTGDIVELGGWVLHEACRELAAWRGAYPAADRVMMSVNVAAAQLAMPSFSDQVARVLRETGVPPELLMLEITESSALAGEGSVTNVQAIADTGVRIALDDFGTGYATLSALGGLPVHTLKIDRSCVAGIDHETQRRRLLHGILGLAESLELEVVAEGVETEAELAELRALGCEQAQGYLFARPAPAAELRARLVSGHPLSEVEEAS